MSKVTEITHPLILHKLAILRDEKTGSKAFRQLVEEISMLMAYEVTRDLHTEEVEVKTPVALTKCKMLAGKKGAGRGARMQPDLPLSTLQTANPCPHPSPGTASQML